MDIREAKNLGYVIGKYQDVQPGDDWATNGLIYAAVVYDLGSPDAKEIRDYSKEFFDILLSPGEIERWDGSRLFVTEELGASLEPLVKLVCDEIENPINSNTRIDTINNQYAVGDRTYYQIYGGDMTVFRKKIREHLKKG